jgi:hypothetical protein
MTVFTKPSNPAASDSRWADAWLDGLAFIVGLGMAWYFQWETRDLVWSLWLSSLVIGYVMIVWSIFGTGIYLAWKAAREPMQSHAESKGKVAVVGAILFGGGLFMLAFFTIHFGGFHYVHSVFLNSFFPVNPGSAHATPNLALYREVFARYWWFLPAAAIAERAAFRFPPNEPAAAAPDVAVTAEAIATRKALRGKPGLQGGMMMAPYRNVIRLHLLIFFFAAAHFAKLDNFLVYAVVYAVYFFPWRLVKRDKV